MSDMRKPKSVKWIDRSLVYSPVYIAICTTQAGFDLTCREYGLKPYSFISAGADATHHHWSKGGKSISVVCVPPRGKRTRAAYAALIVHEAAHAWQTVRKCISESDPSPEFEAYSLQNICQGLFEAVGL